MQPYSKFLFIGPRFCFTLPLALMSPLMLCAPYHFVDTYVCIGLSPTRYMPCTTHQKVEPLTKSSTGFFNGADNENRTRTLSLGSSYSTTKPYLHKRKPSKFKGKNHLEQMKGVEPSSPPWQGEVLAVEPHLQIK